MPVLQCPRVFINTFSAFCPSANQRKIARTKDERCESISPPHICSLWYSKVNKGKFRWHENEVEEKHIEHSLPASQLESIPISRALVSQMGILRLSVAICYSIEIFFRQFSNNIVFLPPIIIFRSPFFFSPSIHYSTPVRTPRCCCCRCQRQSAMIARAICAYFICSPRECWMKASGPMNRRSSKWSTRLSISRKRRSVAFLGRLTGLSSKGI